jgi:hypothetical protein
MRTDLGIDPSVAEDLADFLAQISQALIIQPALSVAGESGVRLKEIVDDLRIVAHGDLEEAEAAVGRLKQEHKRKGAA